MTTRSRFSIVLVLLLVVGGLFPLWADDGYEMNRLHMDVSVGADGRFAITETMDIHFTEPRHGIYREIPVGYGSWRTAVDSIEASVPVEVERNGNYMDLRLGDSQKLLQGDTGMVVSYIYDPYSQKGDGHDDYDEFYYNLIGEGWTAPIHQFSARIEFPFPVDASFIFPTRGLWGSTSSHGVEWTLDDTGRILEIQASGFQPQEALTVRVQMPQGYFNLDRTPAQGGLSSLIYIVATLVACGLAFLVWHRWGRDNEPIVVVRFEPPQGMAPMDVGYCADGYLDTKDVTAMLFYWADRGFLSIEEQDKKGKKVTFTRLKELEDASEHEQHLFTSFFACGKDGVVTLKQLEGKLSLRIEETRMKQKRFFRGEHALKDVPASMASGLLYFLALVPIVGFMVVAGGTYYDEMTLLLGAVGLVCAVTYGGIFSYFSRTWYMKSSSARVAGIVLAILPAIIFCGAGYFLATWMSGIPSVQILLFSLVMVGGSIVIMLCAVMTQKRSPYGQKVLEEILGYRDFIEKVEVDKLKLLIDSDPEFFYHVLSYAIVLGLEDKWAHKFASLAVAPPQWYAGPSYGHDIFFYSMLSSRLNSGMAMAAVPRSSSPSSPGSRFGGSSFGSSGFSGGGFGGGGGRSW